MRHLDLFAGIGGFSLAARWMGWETVAQVEWDEWCQKVLAKNFPDALRFGDIVEFNKMLENGEITTNTKCGTAEVVFNRRSQEIRESMEGNILLPGGRVEGSNGLRQLCDGKPRTDLGHIDIITGGFPCQPFSHAGKRKGTDDSRYLWPAMLETIRRVKPAYVVGENVAGLVSMENGKTLDRILSDLEDEGYATEQVIIPACAVGAWHRRDRIWIIAHNNNTRNGTSRSGIDRNGKAQGEQWEQSQSQFSGYREDVSNPRLLRPEINEEQAAGVVECGEDATHTNYQRQQAGRERSFTGRQEWPAGGCYEGTRQWQSEPPVGRVANGIPNRVDRLKGLGNAIVPQVAYQIFKAIEQYELKTN